VLVAVCDHKCGISLPSVACGAGLGSRPYAVRPLGRVGRQLLDERFDARRDQAVLMDRPNAHRIGRQSGRGWHQPRRPEPRPVVIGTDTVLARPLIVAQTDHAPGEHRCDVMHLGRVHEPGSDRLGHPLAGQFAGTGQQQLPPARCIGRALLERPTAGVAQPPP
jgi:hypothetical protein